MDAIKLSNFAVIKSFSDNEAVLCTLTAAVLPVISIIVSCT